MRPSLHSLGLLFLALGWTNAQSAGRIQAREAGCIALDDCPGLDPKTTSNTPTPTTTTQAQVPDSSSAAPSPPVTTTIAGPFCVPFQDPHVGPKGESYCTCNNQKAYSMYCDGKCPWTTDPPTAYLVPAAGPTPAPSDCMRTDLPTGGPPPGTTFFGTGSDPASATPSSASPSKTPSGSASSSTGPSSDSSTKPTTTAEPGSTTPAPASSTKVPDSTKTPDPSTTGSSPGSGPGTTTAPPATATSTVTQPPAGFSTLKSTDPSWTTNTEVSTTGTDGKPTTLPVLVGCKECGGDHSGIVLFGLIIGGGGGGGGGAAGGGGTLFQLPGLPSFTIGGGGGGGGSTPNTQNQPDNPRESESQSQSQSKSDQSSSKDSTSKSDSSTGSSSAESTTGSQTSQTGSQSASETGSQTGSQTSQPTSTECPKKRSISRRYVPGRGPVTFIEFEAAQDLTKRETVSQAADPLAQALSMIGQGADIESSATKLIRNKFEPKEWKLTDTQKIQLQNAFVTGLEGEFPGSRQFNGQTYKSGLNWKVRWDWEPIDNPNAVNGVSKGVHVNLQVDDLAKKIPSARFGISFNGQPRDATFYYDVVQTQGASLEWDWTIKDYTGIKALPADKQDQARATEETQAVKTLAQAYRAKRETLPSNC